MTVRTRSTTAQRRRTSKKDTKYIKHLKSGAHTGKYLVSVPNEKVDGRTKYKTYGPFVRFEDALDRRDRHIADQKAMRGVAVALGREAPDQTLRDWSKHWLGVLSANKNAASTTFKAQYSFDRYVLPFLGDVALVDLTKDMIEAWRQGRVDAKVGGPSINHALKHLRTCLNRAIDSKSNRLTENPASKVDLVEVARKKRVSRIADYPILIEAAADNYLAAVIQFGVDSGLRASELCGLHWGDLELDRADAQGRPAPRVWLRWHLVSSGATREHALRPGTKASKGEEEYVAISPRTATLLKAHRDRLLAHKLQSKPWARRAGKPTEVFYGATKNDHDGPRYVVPQNPVADDALVFPGEDGTPMVPNSLSGWFIRLGQRTGIHKTPHSMRHDCGSFMLARGVPLSVVSRHLRHATASFTMRVYLHQIQEQERAGADAMEGLWASLEAPQAQAV